MKLKTIIQKIISVLKEPSHGSELLSQLNNNLHLSSDGTEETSRDETGDLPQITPEEIEILLAQDPEVVSELIMRLFRVIIEQQEENRALKRRIKELEDRLNINSKNSNRPPSSDMFIKPKSNRKKSDKPAGGQKGHRGYTLSQVENPDRIIYHRINECRDCGVSLESVGSDELERRQVFDLPPLKIEVSEHRAERKICPRCGSINKADFPQGVEQPAKYGPEIGALIVYLRQYQLLPYKRIREFFEDLFGHTISTGTLVNINRECHNILKPVEEEIKSQITNSPVVHFDETGIRVEANNQWLHVASTSSLTYYFVHPNRGQKATDDMGILPNFLGRALHDNWATYFKYDCDHGLCNAHHLRELTSCEEREAQSWATDMKELLMEIKADVEEEAETSDALVPEKIREFARRYRTLVEEGLELNTPRETEQSSPKRGRKKQTKTRNLLDRLDEREQYVLAFMYDFDVPFDNNQAERDIRMTKVQQKISGTFRSVEGAEIFARIRGYVSTARKNGYSLLMALRSVFQGDPIIPNQQPP